MQFAIAFIKSNCSYPGIALSKPFGISYPDKLIAVIALLFSNP
jgi:hypothetical protein